LDDFPNETSCLLEDPESRQGTTPTSALNPQIPSISQVSTPTTDLFVYGTLLFDEVVQAVTDRGFRSVPARLRGYVRCAIIRDGRHEPYPACRPEPPGVISGRLLFDVDDRSMNLIDRFESEPPDYECRPVLVECDDGQLVEASTYVALPSLIRYLAGEWSVDQFRKDHLTHYLASVIPEMRKQTG